MGLLSRFERRLGGWVEDSFARVFRGKVEPVELAAALAREADNSKAVGAHRVLVPNHYTVGLGSADHDRLSPYSVTLGEELAEMLREHAGEQGYSFIGPVQVVFQRRDELTTGAFRIASRVDADGDEGLAGSPEPVSVPAWEPSRLHVREPAPAPPAAPPIPPAPPAPTAAADIPQPTQFVAPVSAPTTALPTARQYGSLELPDGTRTTVGGQPLVLGRGAEADVLLPDNSVSRRHARVGVEAGRVMVEDLGSTNGTTVNGRPLRTGERPELQDGDRLTLGGATVVYRS